jgi:hypothetical protein
LGLYGCLQSATLESGNASSHVLTKSATSASIDHSCQQPHLLGKLVRTIASDMSVAPEYIELSTLHRIPVEQTLIALTATGCAANDRYVAPKV